MPPIVCNTRLRPSRRRRRASARLRARPTGRGRSSSTCAWSSEVCLPGVAHDGGAHCGGGGWENRGICHAAHPVRSFRRPRKAPFFALLAQICPSQTSQPLPIPCITHTKHSYLLEIGWVPQKPASGLPLRQPPVDRGGHIG